MSDGPRFYVRGLWLVLARLAGIAVLFLIVAVIAAAILVSKVGLNAAIDAIMKIMPG